MKKQTKKVFGIDLGTTYSSIAYVDENGQPAIIRNSENQNVTPSVVFFDDDNVVVGNMAKDSAGIYPHRVVSFIKRAMGEPSFVFEYNSVSYTPEEISSYIIRKVVQDAEEQLDRKITDVVITCPAYFGINEREATQKAGELAGVNVCQIINEPTAAAITYAAVRSPENKAVLVYDLGGGTFDVTLIQIRTDSVEVVCTGGDHNLGGKDWDDRLVSYLVNEFQNETGSDEDILDNPETCQDLIMSVENAKKVLGPRKKAPISISHAGQRVKVELTREKFEEITEALLERTISFTKDMLAEAKEKGYEDFDEIVLVGGATRMPQITERLEKEFSKTPTLFEPDSAVAKGAAIFGWKYALNALMSSRLKKGNETGETKNMVQIIKDAPENFIEKNIGDLDEDIKTDVDIEKTLNVKDVASKSFGVVVLKSKEEKMVFNLIRKNTPIPVNASRDFPTAQDNQPTVKIRIMENDINDKTAPLDNSVEVGTAVMSLPPKMPKNTKITVTFGLNVDGRLSIKAKDKETSKPIKVNFDTSSVIQDDAFKKAKDRATNTSVD